MAEQKGKVFFRTDAGPETGMGHLIRCSALADMIRTDFSINFIFKDTPETLSRRFLRNEYHRIEMPEAVSFKDEPHFLQGKMSAAEKNILVLDGYRFDSDYQAACGQLPCKTVYIDDLVKYRYHCDVLINQADGITENNYNTTAAPVFCLGPAYALLRGPFLTAAKNGIREIDKIDSVFVSFGGADADNITYKVLKALCSFTEIKNIHVLTASVNQNVKHWKNEFNSDQRVHFHSDLSSDEVCEVMKQCHLALCPSSSLSLELCAVGIAMITGMTAENQSNYYRSLLNREAAAGVGQWKETGEKELKNLIVEMMASAPKIKRMLQRQRNYLDGLSDERIRSVFLNLANGH
jgi:UDP-2,4-diacetamido-2,4,6-trideoxy-beta-L-altropyranose hydrolase